MASAQDDNDDSRRADLLQQRQLLLGVEDIHFALASERHDKAAHGLLGELSLVHGISHNQAIARHSIDVMLRELLEHLSCLELSDVDQNGGLVLEHLHLLS